MFTQHLLRVELARRIRAAHADPNPTEAADRIELADLDELAAAEQDIPDVAAIVVLRRFDPAEFARSAVQFAFHLDGERREVWRQAYTRTLFLAGNPANLAERFDWAHVSPDGSIAWFGPASTARSTGLRRLLKRFDGEHHPQLSSVVPVDLPSVAGGAAHRLEIAMRGLSTAEYLVHVNHVLAESVLTGILRRGDRLTLAHVPRLSGPYSALRVHRDNADPSRLRAYAALRPDPTAAGRKTPESE